MCFWLKGTYQYEHEHTPFPTPVGASCWCICLFALVVNLVAVVAASGVLRGVDNVSVLAWSPRVTSPGRVIDRAATFSLAVLFGRIRGNAAPGLLTMSDHHVYEGSD